MSSKTIEIKQTTETIDVEKLSDRDKQVYNAGWNTGWNTGYIGGIVTVLILLLIVFTVYISV